MEEYMLPCLSKKFLGIECFGCGTQRALVLLLKGEFANAFTLFPAIYTLIPFLFVIGLNFIDKSRNYHKYIVSLGIINAAVMVISYFIKHF
ncbi:Protein of unknown function (DUF2752) [Flavobacterium saliperosum S13]|uniref:DUF2752 domain-containing protein n=2 Tax=Flavobacterium saliperosum TaxID=329186 RepID=A0A1G4W0Y4_9FLAO|nr:DUF2752 domain-containing protein [Flavobacterium saliperosum]ESU27520.1 Protein of unknown function (DUF2752) [Flavobacterium saliperosum S13]SCX15022.1 Protein of unknown function [Flavobacterium saliperosum]